MPPPPPLHHRNPYSSNLNVDTNTNAKALQITPRSADQDPTHITHNSISIPSTYGRIANPPNAGVVVGATLGAVAGFLLLLYLLYLSLTSGRRFSASTVGGSTITSATPEEIVDVGYGPRRPFGRVQRGRRYGPGSRRGGSQVVVEESLTDSRSGRGGGGVVEVIEEESVVDPPPSSRYRSHSRSRSRSSSSSRSSRSDRYRRDGKVRGVDPMAYGGGSEFSGRS
ncbi:hypothetical protein BDV18DRAFT_117807 [Aspergillus unguis]